MAVTTQNLDRLLQQLRWKRGRNHRLVITGKCHPDANHAIVYADGYLTVCCQAVDCGHSVAVIKVASS